MTKRLDGERRRLLRLLAVAEENAERRISLELHAHFGQMVTLLRLQVQLSKAACRDGALLEQIAALESSAAHLDEDIHRFALALHPVVPDTASLHSLLAADLDRWSATVGIPADFRVSHALECDVPIARKHAVRRIVQETLTNIAKHASASRVIVTVERTEHDVRLSIEDNGLGFDAKSYPVAEGRLGLLGIHERAELIGAGVDIQSSNGRGTAVMLRGVDGVGASVMDGLVEAAGDWIDVRNASRRSISYL